MKHVDTDRYSARLRAKSIDPETRSILVSRIAGSDQEEDLREPPNCGGMGRTRHYSASQGGCWPDNPLPAGPARMRLGLAPGRQIRAQVFQNAACNWRCWYCYVPFDLLGADPGRSAMLPVSEMVEAYASLRDRPPVLVLSGGQPDLVPEWVPWTMAELASRGMDRTTYLWSDDNLSNDYFWRHLAPEDMDTVRSYRNYGRACCFKGFDRESFEFNTRARPELFDRQFVLAERLARLGIDLYAYVTMTALNADGIEEKMARFVDRLQSIDRLLPLRTVPLKIDASYAPVKGRIQSNQYPALVHQVDAVRCWAREIESRFTPAERSRPIWTNALGRMACEVPR